MGGTPKVGEEAPEALELNCIAARDSIADWMLHAGVGGDDEIAEHPGAEEYKTRGHPMESRAQPFFTEQEKAKEA